MVLVHCTRALASLARHPASRGRLVADGALTDQQRARIAAEDIAVSGGCYTVRGTDRAMTLDNGFGDWNRGWAEYRAGSALG